MPQPRRRRHGPQPDRRRALELLASRNGATEAIMVSGPTTTFFSPSLYFTVKVSPSFSVTLLST